MICDLVFGYFCDDVCVIVRNDFVFFFIEIEFCIEVFVLFFVGYEIVEIWVWVIVIFVYMLFVDIGSLVIIFV